MEMLYNYLSSDQFKHRIEGIIEPFMTLRQQLESEKKTTYTRGPIARNSLNGRWPQLVPCMAIWVESSVSPSRRSSNCSAAELAVRRGGRTAGLPPDRKNG